ncbi:MAG: nuclear transport factor 2 family protein [Rhodobacteraceae bacterium]|nr:nuclear transport factor 2 family protein [Paracoccaceae bacterium]
MSDSSASALALDPGSLGPEARIVHDYLEVSMVPDPERAATCMAADVTSTFTGGRVYHLPSGPAGFNATRYEWLKKDMRQFDVAEGAEGTVVYSTGDLYGEWHDGTPFEGNRYVDRFVVENGKIVKMDVWNDSAERILTTRGIKA